MKKLLFLTSSFLIGSSLVAQTTIYENNFNSGTAAGWSLNTSGSGANQWIVNSEYIGFSGFIDDTPNQPTAIIGSPNSGYLHIHNTTICGALGVCNASFDTGSTSNRSAESPIINTLGYTNVAVSFYCLVEGQSSVSYGVFEYSTNGGATWTQTAADFFGIPSWTPITLSIPAFSNAANLKIRFRWQNGSSGLDPAFAIDEFKVLGTPSTNSITTSSIPTPLSWCLGTAQSKIITFSAAGIYDSGNIFEAQLSDALGSFAAPTMIGSLTSAMNGTQNINVNIPNNIPVGSNYSIRVVSSSPLIVGLPSTISMEVTALPNVSLNPLNNLCVNAPILTLSGGSPTGGTYSGPGVTGGSFNPATAGVGVHTIVYSFTNSDNCSGTASQTIQVDGCSSINELETQNAIIYPNPTNASFSVLGPSNIESIELLDLTGKVVQRNTKNQESYSVEGMPAGLYIVAIYSSNGNYQTKLRIN